MKSISSFQITDMTLAGFKCYQEPTRFSFGNPTVITGGNGRGKSSIADAIAFAITGLPFFGERGLDRLHCESNPELFVSLRFTDQDGQSHELTRTRQNGRMTITYDGYDIRQLDLTEMFGEKDVFLSILNPLYFIEELGEDGKNLLERYLPTISHEEVLDHLSEEVRAAMEHESISSPEAYLKKRREEIRDLEQTVIYLTGQKDLTDTQKKDAQQNVTDLKAKYSALAAERNSLEGKRFEGFDLAEMRERLVTLSERYDELAKDGSSSVDTSELEQQLQALHHKLGQRSAEQYVPQYTQPIAEAEARVKELAQKYNREAKLLQGFQPGTVCPTCRRAVTEADLSLVLGEIKKSIAAITAEGKEQKGQLDELRELEAKARAVFLQSQQEDVEKIRQEIEELTRRREGVGVENTALDSHRRTELETLHAQIQTLTADIEYGTLTQAEYDRLMECHEAIRECQAELDAALNAADREAEDYGAKIAQIESQILDKKKLLSNAAIYAGKRAELTFEHLKMNKVEISLSELVKSTGELKDVFKFTYGGRRYDRLALSEKIRAGMELSELMKQLTGRNYPVFIDNMECVDDLANVRPTGQIIMAKCVHNAALAVKPMGQVQMPMAA